MSNSNQPDEVTSAFSQHRRLGACLAAACLIAVSIAGTWAAEANSAEPSARTQAGDDRPIIGIEHTGPIKVVFQISKGDTKGDVGKGLFYLRKLHEGYLAAGVDPGRLDIRAVYHGDAAEHLLTDEAWNRVRGETTGNPNTALLTELARRGVSVELCNTRRIENGWAKSDIHPDVLLVRGAYQRIIDLQLRGYAYIRF